MRTVLTIMTVMLLHGMTLRAASDTQQTTGVVNPIQLKESKILVKVPKKLHTFVPFWGVPVRQNGTKEAKEWRNDIVLSREDSTAVPRWVCWNLDLATVGHERVKYETLLPKGTQVANPELLAKVLNECYRWAWRKPYGRTNVVWGPMYHPKGGDQPYAFFVAVCKEERVKSILPLGYTSTAFIVPNYPVTTIRGIYDCCASVNMVEYKTGYNLFPTLPAAVQEKVEELTDYELFCPFQEIDDSMLDYLEVEFDRPVDGEDGPAVTE